MSQLETGSGSSPCKAPDEIVEKKSNKARNEKKRRSKKKKAEMMKALKSIAISNDECVQLKLSIILISTKELHSSGDKACNPEVDGLSATERRAAKRRLKRRQLRELKEMCE